VSGEQPPEPRPRPDWQRPAPAEVWRAVGLYLRIAYGGAPDASSSSSSDGDLPKAVPSAVRNRLQSLREAPEAEFFQSPQFERDVPEAQGPARYALRLGNRAYPHMKLVIHRAPSGGGFLFRTDTHDAHCRPDPASREYGVFCALMDQNRTTAEAIEAAWEEAGLPTFKKFLRDDLARRQAAR
jgi:hypothetical protein